MYHSKCVLSIKNNHDLDPLPFGWMDRNGLYSPDWFTGTALLEELFEEEESENGINVLPNYPTNEAVEFVDDELSTEESWTDDSES